MTTPSASEAGGVSGGDDLSVGGVEDSDVGDEERGGRTRGPGIAGVADEVVDVRAVWEGDMVGSGEAAADDTSVGEEEGRGAASVTTSSINIPWVGGTPALPMSREGGP